MTTKQILDLDCRSQKNREIIQRVLRPIKPLSRYSVEDAIPISGIEKAIQVMSQKYGMYVREFIPDFASSSRGVIWSADVVCLVDPSTVVSVYGLSFYEVLAKIAIYMYAQVRRQKQQD